MKSIAVVITFLSLLLYSIAVQSPWGSSTSFEFSSLLPNQNACLKFYSGKNNYFSPVLFIAHKAKLRSQETISDDDIRSSLHRPERFLAIIELMSEKENYAGFQFEDRLQDLNPKDLKKLQSTLTRYTKQGSLSGIKFSNMLVSVYRIVHKPKSIWGQVWETRSVTEAFERLDDSVLRERIELSLFNENMETTFQTIVSDPTLTQRFIKTVKQNADWIDTGVFLALWMGAFGSKFYYGANFDLSIQGMMDLMPPYIPGTGHILKVAFSKDDLSMARKEGLNKAMENAKVKFKSTFKKIHAVDFVRWSYAAIFTTYFAMTIGPQIREYQANLLKETFLNAVEQIAEESRRRNTMSAEELGEESFQEYLSFLDEKGIKYDINSPELQAIRKDRIESTRAALANLQKTNPEYNRSRGQ